MTTNMKKADPIQTIERDGIIYDIYSKAKTCPGCGKQEITWLASSPPSWACRLCQCQWSESYKLEFPDAK